jgi:hypothetical protein
MNMVRHDHKLVQPVFSLIAVLEEHSDHEARPSIDPKNKQTLPCNRRDEKCPFRIHISDHRYVGM